MTHDPHSEESAMSERIPIDELIGTLGPEWTGGLCSVCFIRHQRDDDDFVPCDTCQQTLTAAIDSHSVREVASGIPTDISTVAGTNPAHDLAPAETGDWVQHLSGKVRRVRTVKSDGYFITDEGSSAFGDTWAWVDCVKVDAPTGAQDPMTHDPLCPRSDSRNGQHCEDCGPWCQCHLIAKVRADTLDRALDAVEDAWDQGYNYAPSRVQAMRAIVAQREKS